MLYLGAHMSVSGGLHNAIADALATGSDSVQIFTKNQRQWKAKPTTDEAAALFKEKFVESGLKQVISHNSYLINMASPKDELWEKSIDAQKDELERAQQLDIPYVVAHPGSHVGSGEEVGLNRIVDALNRIHAETAGYTPKTLLETTAGQGTNLGSKFEDLSYILERVAQPERLGVCFDTCHVFVAGYDIRTPETYAATMEEFDRVIGLDQILAFHFNDSKGEIGSKKDRHDLIGKGFIGVEGFRNFMNDSRFQGKSAYLETEKGDDLEEDIAAINLLRSLVG